jgi:crotonobetainyl-CoA:carnitine CoA-transferase CaiB-like acyl-CoA transferase
MAGMLDGVRVVEYTRLWEDRVGMLLGDLGAEVVKLEPVGGCPTRTWWGEVTPGWSPFHLALNRNKKSFAADLAREEGVRLAERLVATADIFVRSYYPTDPMLDTLDYEALRKVNERLIYCDLSPFGREGQYGHLAATLDHAAAAAGRWRPARGEDGRVVVSPGIDRAGGDSGALYAAYGVVAAYWRRGRTGQGAYLDVSQMDAQLTVKGDWLVRFVEDDRVYEQAQGGGGGPAAAKYNWYETSDGKFMLLALIERQFWNSFARAAGRPDLVDEREWDAPVDFAKGDMALRREIQSITRQKTLAEWVAIFRDHRIAGGPGVPPEELGDDPHLQERGVILETDHPAAGPFMMPGSPIVQVAVRIPAPALGEHTAELLAELGHAEAEVQALRQRGIIV